MKYSILSQNISIVVLGTFNPETIDPIWMVKKNILAIEDLENGCKSSSDTLFFKTSKFEVLVTCDRIQVVSFNISDSDIISQFVIKLLMCLKTKELKAVGINSQKIFSLFNDSDMLDFCHHFAPLNALGPISSNSLMLNIEWESCGEPRTDTSPIKQISLKRVFYGENNRSFCISVNNHHKVNTFLDAISIVKLNAYDLHLLFNEQFANMMKSIN